MQIFTNKRAIRNYTKRLGDGEIGELITIQDFISKVIYREDFSKINSLEREIIFNSVVKKTKKDIFNIDTNIFNFLSYSRHFFSFFEELALEKVEIESLQKADYYEDYKKHIDILKEIYTKFETELDQKKYLDSIFLPKNYKINFQYLERVSKIKFHFEGRLSNFYVEIFNRIAEKIHFEIEFTKSRFNSKISEQLETDFENEFLYRFDLSKKEILSKEKVGMSRDISLYKFKNRLSQIGFVKEKIWFAVEKLGIEPEKIGVVLLDERFAPTLKAFDKIGNLNFSMGISIKESEIYKKFFAIYKFLESKYSEENRKRISKFFQSEEEISFFLENWNRKIEIGIFTEKITEIILSDKTTPKTILPRIAQILTMFQTEIFQRVELRILFRLFFEEFETLTIDDVRGGKITVQGLLETRGAEYDFVVILDFNDEVFPKREEKDFFINSEIRKSVGLPLIEDREGLQKTYFERIFQKAKHISISYLQSETAKISRFSHDFKFKEIPQNDRYEKHLIAQILETQNEKFHWNSESVQIVKDFSFVKKPLSNYSMRTFLECRRRYYFKYLLSINGENEKNINFEIGNLLHNVLKKLYSQNQTFQNINDLRSEFQKIIINENFERTYKIFWTQKLENFFQNEISRFQNGIKVYEVEKLLSTTYRGFQFRGIIDRIDILENDELEIIDYKTTDPSKFRNSETGKNENDFQLVIYYILLRENGYKIDFENLYYYNLTSGKLIKNSRTLEDLHKELDKFIELQKEKIDFFETEKCNIFCEYKTICNRD
jgi:ATP-dependent helicase/nuclease subunit B